MSDNNICGNCGEPFELGTSFCQQCGWKIPENPNLMYPQNNANAAQPIISQPAPIEYNSQISQYSQIESTPYQSISQNSYGTQNAPVNSQQQFQNNIYNNQGVPQYSSQKRISPVMIGVIGFVGVIVVVLGAYFISKGSEKDVEKVAGSNTQSNAVVQENKSSSDLVGGKSGNANA